MINLQLTKNFNLNEFFISSKANELKINNECNEPNVLYNIGELAEKVLQPIRDAWCAPIKINSGYRCEELNKAVGGVSTSQHCNGSAADITAGTKAKNKDLYNLIVSLGKQGKIKWRQLINENNYSWLHIAINDGEHSWRENQTL